MSCDCTASHFATSIGGSGLPAQSVSSRWLSTHPSSHMSSTPQSEAPPPPSRWAELESVRGLAAMLIVVYHMPHWYPPFFAGVVQNGYLMVELFFVLSGFVIAGAYAGRIHSVKDLFRFQFLRWARLYPVHLLFLLIYLGFEFMKLYAQSRQGMAMPNSQPFRENSWEAFFTHLFLLQGILPNGHFTAFNGPSWSISVEFYTYFVFGLLAWLAGRWRAMVFLLLSAAALAALLSGQWLGFSPLLRCLTGFFMGCLLADAVKRLHLQVPGWAPALVFAAIVLFLIFKPEGQGDWAIFFLSAALIYTIVKSGDSVFKRWMRAAPLVWLGTISYSVYMSHYAVEWVMNQVIRVVLKRPEVFFDGRNAPALGPFESLAAHLVVVAVVLLVAHVTYTRVESPLREWSRKVVGRSN